MKILELFVLESLFTEQQLRQNDKLMLMNCFNLQLLEPLIDESLSNNPQAEA